MRGRCSSESSSLINRLPRVERARFDRARTIGRGFARFRSATRSGEERPLFNRCGRTSSRTGHFDVPPPVVIRTSRWSAIIAAKRVSVKRNGVNEKPVSRASRGGKEKRAAARLLTRVPIAINRNDRRTSADMITMYEYVIQTR